MAHRLSRAAVRTLAMAAVTSLALVPAAGARAATGDTVELTMLATTDTHGNVRNWDYFKNAPYSDKQGGAIGLAQAGGHIEKVRAERGAESVFVVDNGDILQGTPLDYWAAKVKPFTTNGTTHPMAGAFNALKYDAQSIGNHEFNYGLDLLNAYKGQLNFPLLAANVVDATTGKPVHQGTTIIERTPKGADSPVKIGVLGLTTPGSMIWDKGNLDGKVKINDMTETAKVEVPKLKAAGADIIVVLSHAGIGQSSYAPAEGLGPENPVEQIAQVPGIDAMVIGHTHQDIPEKRITNTTTGKEVVITQPYRWAGSVSDMVFKLTDNGPGWTLGSIRTAKLASQNAPESQAVLTATDAAHKATVAYVNQVVARSTEELPAAKSRYEDTAILDYIQMVQTNTVTKALAGGQYAGLPVLSIAAPFSREAVFPKGDVTVRDIAGLYIYDNTLEAVVMTGSQVRDYLEFSAKYFGQVAPGGKFDPEKDTSVTYNGQQVWDYNYDVSSGIKYDINVSKPVGQRIENLTMPDGSPVAGDAKFVVAVNNYRRSGGGAFPHIAKAPVVYNAQLEIRQALIDHAAAKKVIDPADFYAFNWKLTGTGLATPTPTPTPSASASPTAAPSASPTASPAPTAAPTAAPSAAPTVAPSAKPAPKPTPTGPLADTGGPALAVLLTGLLSVAGGGWLLRRRR
ncbi:bifunctional metallophosphatase/5'-nucleotidase [Mariniluteicoccus flavus]